MLVGSGNLKLCWVGIWKLTTHTDWTKKKKSTHTQAHTIYTGRRMNGIVLHSIYRKRQERGVKGKDRGRGNVLYANALWTNSHE